MANDGNPATSWQAPADAADAWWQVDIERYVDPRQVKITFPTGTNYRYKVEISTDSVHWILIDDQTRTPETKTTRTSVPTPRSSGRYGRVTFQASRP